MFGPKLGEMRVERTILEQIRDDVLREVLRVEIGALLDDGQLFDDGSGGRGTPPDGDVKPSWRSCVL